LNTFNFVAEKHSSKYRALVINPQGVFETKIILNWVNLPFPLTEYLNPWNDRRSLTKKFKLNIYYIRFLFVFN
jgi:hypothetical protein